MIEHNQFLPEGTLLFNATYRIEKVLGHGGFGITYLATNIHLNKKVAIKEFFPSTFCSRDDSSSRIVTMGTSGSETISLYREKFLKEARNIAKLKNPHIIAIQAAFEENDTAYYVMDYIEGGSLSQIVKRGGPLPIEKAMDYIRQVGEALDYLHGRKMNHLDVKPANIMVREDGTAVLIDFGLSKQYDTSGNQTSTTPVGISHGFAPLEQYNPEGVKEFSSATDLYSLAATFYYLITGLIPPDASDLVESDLTFPAAVPQGIRRVIMKAMAPIRNDRYQSAAIFYQDLVNPPAAVASGSRNYNDDETLVMQPNTIRGQRENKRSNKNGIIYGSIIGLVVILGVLLILFIVDAREKDRKAQQARQDSIVLAQIEAQRLEEMKIEAERAEQARLDSIRQDSIRQEDKMRISPSIFRNYTIDEASIAKRYGFTKIKSNMEYDPELDMETGTIVYSRTFHGRRIDYEINYDTCYSAYLIFFDARDKQEFLDALKRDGYVKNEYGGYTYQRNDSWHTVYIEGNRVQVGDCG